VVKRQTRHVQVVVPSRACGFKSRPEYQFNPLEIAGFFMSGGGAWRLLSNAWPLCLRETLTADQAQALLAFLETYITPAGTGLPALHNREGRFVPQPAA
jgi:hypothetical protein